MEQGVIKVKAPFRVKSSDRDNTLLVKCETDEVSDGYHTFGELYEHRHALFLALMRVAGPSLAWYSMKHSDGNPTYPGWILCGLDLPGVGMVSYHLPERLRPEIVATGAEELNGNGKWDGHTSADVVRRLKLFVSLACGHHLDGTMQTGSGEQYKTPEARALGLLREARAALLELRDSGKPSRELSLAITETETGLLWLQEDMRLKAPVVNEAVVRVDTEALKERGRQVLGMESPLLADAFMGVDVQRELYEKGTAANLAVDNGRVHVGPAFGVVVVSADAPNGVCIKEVDTGKCVSLYMECGERSATGHCLMPDLITAPVSITASGMTGSVFVAEKWKGADETTTKR